MEMNNLERLRKSKVLQKRLAKYIARFCFRDGTILEDLHSDPGSRISQAEMRALMIGAVQNCYMLVGLLIDEIDDRPGLLAACALNGLLTGTPRLLDALEVHDFNPGWNDPQESDGGNGRRLLGLPEPGRNASPKQKPRLAGRLSKRKRPLRSAPSKRRGGGGG